jgi:hypothetical protein
MQDDFSTYEKLKSAGTSPEDVYRKGMHDGLGRIVAFRMIRKVFDLDVVQAKDVIARCEGAPDLNSHQARIAEALGTKDDAES